MSRLSDASHSTTTGAPIPKFIKGRLVYDCMGRRLTDYPLKLAFEIVESAANTFTQVEIDTPVGQLTSSGKVQAMECMSVDYDLQSPSREDDMDNFTEAQLARSSQTGAIEYNDPDRLWAQQKETNTTVGSENVIVQKGFERDRLDDNDGAGTIFYGGTMFGGILGVGNASARFCDGAVNYHLIELDAIDVVQALLTA